MFKKTNLYSWIAFCLVISNNAFAQFVPAEFQHFYDFEENDIKFVLPNGFDYEAIAFSNYYGIEKVKNRKALREAILNSGVKEEYVDDVIKAILSGKNTKENNSIRTNFSFEQKSISVSVPATYLSEERKSEQYTTLEPDHSALIVGQQLFANYYDGNTSATLNSDMTMGLGNGYLSADFSLSGGSEVESTFDSNEVSYEHNLNSVMFKVGYGKYGVNKYNSTSNLDYTNSSENYYVSVGSSDNLFISDEKEYKKIYFDIKNSGTVEVLRDGRAIYTQSFLKGQHSISYKHLPKGNYNVELIIRADGHPEEKTIRRINNNIAETSHNGYDYNITVRNSEYESGYNENGKDLNKRLTFGDFSFTKSLMHDSILVGVSGQSDGDSFGFGGLAKYTNGWLDIDAFYNNVDHGQYYASSLNVAGFTFDFANYEGFDTKHVSNVSPLLKAMYGMQPFRQSTLSYSFPVLSSSVNLYGSRTKYGESQGRSGFESQNLALDYNTTIFKNLKLNLSFSRTLNDNASKNSDAENIYSANITIPLGDNHTTYSSGMDSSSRSGQRLVNNITYQQSDITVFDDVDTNATTSINSYIDGQQSELTASGVVNMNNEQFNSSVYANISNHSATNMSLNAQTTAIITKDGIYQTKRDNEAYVIVESEAKGGNVEKNAYDFGLLDSQVNSGYHMSTPIDSTTKIIGLDEFSSYKFQIDNEISGFRSSRGNHDGQTEMFTYPGSIHKISNKVEPIVTFLSYFEDFNDSPLNDVKCIGDGCVSVGRVGDGIYSISLVKNKPFKVASGGEYCFIEAESKNNNSAMTKCFPKIKVLENGMQLVASGFGDGQDKIYYLGILDGKIDDEILEKSELAKIEYIKYNFANNIHLFAKSNINIRDDEAFDIVRKQVFEEIQNYVKSRNESDFFAENR
ncbi:TcfC E-set like domain-containing protein [Vibrio campbellii]|nr:TcfC E-set like domain-containing protein [Vibrio campbellii]